MDLSSFFSEPLSYAFIQRGMLALLLVGGINAVVGCFVVVRGMAFLGDALAHAILPGIALSYTASGGSIGSNLFVGGLGAGVVSAFVIGWLTRNADLNGGQRHRHRLRHHVRAGHRHSSAPRAATRWT